MRYVIEIDEQQRQILLDGLLNFPMGLLNNKQLDELGLLIGMIEELPEHEKQVPGLFHSLCS